MATVPIDYSRILFDQRGAPYWLNQQGGKVFLPPLVAMQSNDPRAVEWARAQGVYTGEDGQITNQSAPGSSLFKNRGEWDSAEGEWDQGINWNNIAAMGVGGLMAAPAVAGAIGAGGGAGGSQAAAGSVLPSASIPGMHAAVPGAIASQGVSAGIGAGGGALAGSAIPGLHNAVPGAVTGSQGASAIGSVLKNIASNGGGVTAGKSLLDRILGTAGKYAPLALGAGSLIKGLTQGRSPAEDRMDAILKMAEDRARQQEPLFKAITTMAHAQLPNYAREGR